MEAQPRYKGGLRGGCGPLVGFNFSHCIGIVFVVQAIFERLAAWPATHRFLSGAIAVAIGLSIAMGVQAGRRVLRGRDPVPWALMVVCFVLAGPLQAPAAPVILGLGGFGILYFLWRGRHA